MADNIELDAGSGGATVAADDVGGVHYQVVKLDVGADGVAAPLSNSNPLPISDAGGTLTVDGTVTANLSATDNAVLDAIAASVAGTLTVGSHAVTNAGTFAVQATGTVDLGATDNAVLDAIAASVGTIDNAISGNEMQVDVLTMPSVAVTNAGTFAVQAVCAGVAAEDAAASGNPVLVGGRYDSSARTLETGDAGAIALNASGQVLVEIAAGAGSGGTAAADDADFTAGTTSGTPAMGVYESSPSSVTDGDLGTVGITQTRALKVAIDSGGVSGRAEDAAHSTGHEGIVMLAVRRDTAAVGSDTDGDYSTINVDSTGRLHVNVGNTVAVASHAVTNAGTFAVQNTAQASTNTQEIVGDVAHDAAAAGNPVQTGGYATNAIEGVTQVAAGDLTRTVHDLNGVQVVRPHTTLEEIQSVRTTNTDGNSTSLVAAAGAGVHNYLSNITIWNSSSTDGFVDLRDGTAGSVLYTLPAPQTGGCTVSFPIPLKFGDNTAIAFDASGAISTIYISAVFFQAQG